MCAWFLKLTGKDVTMGIPHPHPSRKGRGILFFPVILLLMFSFLLTGCESIFGKEAGKRGALPGKREDVFNAERTLRPNATEGETVTLGEENERADWPQAGGSLTRLHGAQALAASVKEVWSASIGAGSQDDGALMAVPVIADGKIFTLDSQAQLSAFSIKDGTRLWQKNIPENVGDEIRAGAGLAYDGGKVYAALSDGYVLALDAASGKVLWTRNLATPLRAAPTLAGETLYIVTAANVLHQINLSDGVLGWSHAGIQESTSFLGMASPTLLNDVVVVPYSSGEVFGLRALNGRMAWEENLASTKRTGTLPAMADIQGQPVVDGDKIYVASHSGRFVALDGRAGARVFEADLGSVQTPYVAGNAIFVVTTENQLAALSRKNGHILWAVSLQRYADEDDRTSTVLWTGPVLAGGKLWLANSLGFLKAFDPQDGREKESHAIGAPIYLPPLVAGRTLYVLDDKGTLTAFR